ncbi:hypothetical protein BH10PSE12_BH10PSE12_30510 [soil metagenome]
MGFALSKLTAFARGRSRSPGSSADMPVLRRADAHPDAPARRPIFASSDFAGNDIFANASDIGLVPAVVDRQEQIFDFASLTMPRAPDPMPVTEDEPAVGSAPMPLDIMPGDQIVTGFAPLAAPVPPAGMEAPVVSARTEPRPPMDGLTIAELAERFERGLARRVASAPQTAAPDPIAIIPAPRVLADIPPAAAVTNKADIDAEVDRALRDALGALQKISAR